MARWGSAGLAVAVCMVAVGCGDLQENDEQSLVASTVAEAATETTVYPEEGDGGYYGGDSLSSGYTGPELPLLYHRETPGGVSVWLRLANEYGSPMPATTAWQAPGWCFPDAMVRTSFRFGESVGEAWADRYREPYGGAAMRVAYGGYAEGNPLAMVVVQVAPEVTEVSATWADGSTDAVQPEGGWAALVAMGAHEDEPAVTITDSAGSRLVESMYAEPGRWEMECMEPEYSLPVPGEQPADAAAAEAALRARFDELWAGDMKATERFPEYIDDATGLAEASDAVLNGQYADQVSTVKRLVNQVVFVSPTEAWFSYFLSSSSIGRPFFGHAYMVDGKWVFVRAMVCQEIALAGEQCSPAELTLAPPQG